MHRIEIHTAAREKFFERTALCRGFRMKRKLDPLNLYVEALSQFFNTHGTEIAPRSNEVGEDLQQNGLGCHVCSMTQNWKFSVNPFPVRLYPPTFTRARNGPPVALLVVPLRRVYENRKRQLPDTERASCRKCSGRLPFLLLLRASESPGFVSRF